MSADDHDRARVGPWGGALLCSVVVACAGMSGAAQAESYSIETGSDVRVEANDNVNLQAHSPGTVKTLALSSTISASRRAENSATLVGATLTALQQWGRGANDRIDGRVGLTQSFNDALNTLTASAQYTQDFNNTIQNADVTVNPGQRRSASVSVGWSRALTERLSANTQVETSQTRYGKQAPAAVASRNYRNTQVSAGLSYAVTEVDSVSVQASHSDYRSEGGGNRSLTNDISISGSHLLGERGSVSLQLGGYQTDSNSPRTRFVCPVAAVFCQLGLAQPIVVSDRAQSSSTGLIYGATYRYQFGETSSLSLAIGSRQSPSGAGEVVQNKTLSMGFAHSFSETLNGAVSLAQSRSAYHASTTNQQSLQRTVAVSLSKQLARDLSLQSTYQWTEADNVGFGGTAHSNSIGVALKYDWPTFQAPR